MDRWVEISLELHRTSELFRDAMRLPLTKERTTLLKDLESQLEDIRRQIAELKVPKF